MGPVETFHKEWAVISGAPWSFTFAVLAAGGIIWWIVWLISRGEKNGLKEQIAAMRAQKELAVQISVEEKERSKRLAEELTNLKKQHVPPAFNQVANSSTQVIQSLFEIEEKKTMRFAGAPESWAPEQMNKFAQFALLRDAQAVTINVYGGVPQHTVVTSTSTASEITGYINSLKNPYK